jgi:hypothetical protein
MLGEEQPDTLTSMANLATAEKGKEKCGRKRKVPS